MSETIEFFPIQVQLADWHSSRDRLTAIRHQVFVEEQGVPREEEIDSLDPAALHWLALSGEDAPMGTARLVGNRIGRMAVLAGYRNKGVGSSLMRAIIKYARGQGMDTLTLDAQTQALPFYLGFGFTVTGEEFDDVGIPHQPMALNLSRFESPRSAAPLPDVDDEQRLRRILDDPQSFADAALDIARTADRTLRIFSQRLDTRLYDNDAFCEAILRTATRHPNAEVLMLVRDTSQLLKQSHRLVDLFQRLTSRLQLRKLNPERDTAHKEFLTGDEASVLYNQAEEGYQGYHYRYAPLEARHLNQDFDSLWDSSEPDPTIRRLHI